MPRIDRLFISTDFDTLKSDDVKTAAFTIPGGAGIAAGATATYSATVSVGEAQSLLIVQARCDPYFAAGLYENVTTALRYDRTGGGGAPYSIILRYAHSGGNAVQVIASIFNNSASPLTLNATAETWTWRVRSFKVPKFQ